LKVVSINQFFTKREKLEYLYRSARLYHKAGQVNEGITYYLKTIELSKDENYYFAPNSALQLGYIYLSRVEKEEAKKYFQLALSYKNYEYKNSIDNKAKAALNELKD
jgi:tetratricopeptide (TPR) repeat protein